MANDISGRPWRLDTQQATPVANWWINVEHFEWTGFGNGQTLELRDINGREVWRAVTTAGEVESVIRSGKINQIQGLVPALLPAGVVTAYIK